MKKILSYCLLLLFFMIVMAPIRANSNEVLADITVKVKDASLEEVFALVSKETGLKFFYTDKQLKNADLKINLNFESVKLEQVLAELEKQANLIFLREGNTISVSSKTANPATIASQTSSDKSTQKLSGKIVDEFGEPSVGVSITIKGTTRGTMTNVDGDYQIDVSKGQTIEVSYLGFQKQEFAYKGQSTLDVILKEDVQLLDDVVIVGFGTQKKINLTGSVGIASANDLESRPVTTAAQALQGIVPGLQITQSSGGMGSRAEINIRGIATIGEGSSGSPLVLIDGMEGDMHALNPQDIENISVLKDAAASSIYGSRAPFGVILITTKRGKSGKPNINYNNSFRWSDPLLKQKQIDSYKFALYFNEGHANGNLAPYFDLAWLKRIKDYRDGNSDVSMIVNPDNPNSWNEPYGSASGNEDWYRTIYKSWSFTQDHNFSVNGGAGMVDYYLSMNFLDQGGQLHIANDSFNRYTATGKIGVQLTDWAKVTYTSRFIREKISKPSAVNNIGETLTRQAWPYIPSHDPNGFLFSAPSPALSLAEGGRSKIERDDLYQQAQLMLEPVKNWKTFADLNFRFSNSFDHENKQLTYNHDVNGKPYPDNTTSYVAEDIMKANYTNINLFTEYSHKLNDDHNLKGMVGFQSEEMKDKYVSAKREGIIVPSLPNIDITSGTGWDGKPIPPSVGGRTSSWSTAGFFGRLNYEYKDRYLLEANIRYDGTSRFRKNDRWNWFPSFSAGWNIAREDFWKPYSDWLSTFKLRVSYGNLGNQNTQSLYPTYRVMGYTNSADISANNGWMINGQRPNVALPPSLISPSLTWEKIQTWNFGLDYGALNNRLTGSFDYFVRKTLDMIGPAPELPNILGTAVPKMNNTDLRTYGWELSIGWTDRLKNGLSYGARFMLADSQTEITRFPNKTGKLDTFREGMILGEIWGYETIGIAKTEAEMQAHLNTLQHGGQNALATEWGAGDIMYKDTNNDGRIDGGANTLDDHGDKKIIGNSTPRYQFGLDLNADYKGFDCRIFMQGVMKRDIYQNSATFWGIHGGMWWSTAYEEHMDFFRDENSVMVKAGEAGVNTNAFFPRPSFRNGNKNHQEQTKYLQNAAYIRLKNIQFGYTLPQHITQKMQVAKLRLFFSGENLWTGTNLFETLDPETVGTGYGGAGYPLMKTVSIGLSVTL